MTKTTKITCSNCQECIEHRILKCPKCGDIQSADMPIPVVILLLVVCSIAYCLNWIATGIKSIRRVL